MYDWHIKITSKRRCPLLLSILKRPHGPYPCKDYFPFSISLLTPDCYIVIFPGSSTTAQYDNLKPISNSLAIHSDCIGVLKNQMRQWLNLMMIYQSNSHYDKFQELRALYNEANEIVLKVNAKKCQAFLETVKNNPPESEEMARITQITTSSTTTPQPTLEQSGENTLQGNVAVASRLNNNVNINYDSPTPSIEHSKLISDKTSGHLGKSGQKLKRRKGEVLKKVKEVDTGKKKGRKRKKGLKKAKQKHPRIMDAEDIAEIRDLTQLGDYYRQYQDYYYDYMPDYYPTYADYMSPFNRIPHSGPVRGRPRLPRPHFNRNQLYSPERAFGKPLREWPVVNPSLNDKSVDETPLNLEEDIPIQFYDEPTAPADVTTTTPKSLVLNDEQLEKAPSEPFEIPSIYDVDRINPKEKKIISPTNNKPANFNLRLSDEFDVLKDTFPQIAAPSHIADHDSFTHNFFEFPSGNARIDKEFELNDLLLGARLTNDHVSPINFIGTKINDAVTPSNNVIPNLSITKILLDETLGQSNYTSSDRSSFITTPLPLKISSPLSNISVSISEDSPSENGNPTTINPQQTKDNIIKSVLSSIEIDMKDAAKKNKWETPKPSTKSGLSLEDSVIKDILAGMDDDEQDTVLGLLGKSKDLKVPSDNLDSAAALLSDEHTTATNINNTYDQRQSELSMSGSSISSDNQTTNLDLPPDISGTQPGDLALSKKIISKELLPEMTQTDSSFKGSPTIAPENNQSVISEDQLGKITSDKPHISTVLLRDEAPKLDNIKEPINSSETDLPLQELSHTPQENEQPTNSTILPELPPNELSPIPANEQLLKYTFESESSLSELLPETATSQQNILLLPQQSEVKESISQIEGIEDVPSEKSAEKTDNEEPHLNEEITTLGLLQEVKESYVSINASNELEKQVQNQQSILNVQNITTDHLLKETKEPSIRIDNLTLDITSDDSINRTRNEEPSLNQENATEIPVQKDIKKPNPQTDGMEGSTSIEETIKNESINPLKPKEVKESFARMNIAAEGITKGDLEIGEQQANLIIQHDRSANLNSPNYLTGTTYPSIVQNNDIKDYSSVVFNGKKHSREKVITYVPSFINYLQVSPRGIPKLGTILEIKNAQDVYSTERYPYGDREITQMNEDPGLQYYGSPRLALDDEINSYSIPLNPCRTDSQLNYPLMWPNPASCLYASQLRPPIREPVMMPFPNEGVPVRLEVPINQAITPYYYAGSYDDLPYDIELLIDPESLGAIFDVLRIKPRHVLAA